MWENTGPAQSAGTGQDPASWGRFLFHRDRLDLTVDFGRISARFHFACSSREIKTSSSVGGIKRAESSAAPPLEARGINLPIT